LLYFGKLIFTLWWILLQILLNLTFNLAWNVNCCGIDFELCLKNYCKFQISSCSGWNVNIIFRRFLRNCKSKYAQTFTVLHEIYFNFHQICWTLQFFPQSSPQLCLWKHWTQKKVLIKPNFLFFRPWSSFPRRFFLVIYFDRLYELSRWKFVWS
jgi:hypothetical protein